MRDESRAPTSKQAEERSRCRLPFPSSNRKSDKSRDGIPKDDKKDTTALPNSEAAHDRH